MTIHPVDYLLIGHMTADLTASGREIGGTVSYAAGTAAAFQRRVGVLTSAAPEDPLLGILRQFADVVVHSAGHTTTFENIYQPQGRVQFIRATAEPLRPDLIPAAWVNAPLVHFAPIADELNTAVVERFPNSTRLLTLQGWLRRSDDDGRVRFRRWFDEDVLHAVDFVIFSEEDIAEAPELEHQIARVARCLIVTRAERGGTIYVDGRASSYRAIPAEVTHPTGAGDIFAASLLCALSAMNFKLDQAVCVAADLASRSVTRSGLASVPTWDEVQHALKHYEGA
jgi:sugar/nucleoside kinase (ribokinase family)